jgi:molecular chaperone DnaK
MAGGGITMMVGINLGISASEIACLIDGKPVVIPSSTGGAFTSSIVSMDEWQVSSEILKRLKKCAEDFLQQTVDSVVIAVPISFGFRQMYAIAEAARLAEFKEVRFVLDHVAALIACSIKNVGHEAYTLVYDLDEYAFVLTLLSQFDGIIKVIAGRSIEKLGGEVFDEAIQSWYINEIIELGLSVSYGLAEKPIIKKAAKEARRVLSSFLSAEVSPDFPFIDEDGSSFYVKRNLTRDRFEEITAKLLLKTGLFITALLNERGFAEEDIGLVLPIGEVTRMPMVLNLLNKRFPGRVASCVNTDLMVVSGAAIYAGSLSGAPDAPAGITPEPLYPL